MNDKIINMALKTENAMLQTPEMCLKGCLEDDIGKQRAFKKCRKLLIIALDDTEGQYDTSWNQAGMKASEVIALLETIKQDIYCEIRG